MDNIKVNKQLSNEYIAKGYWTNDTLLSRFLQSSEKYAHKEYIVDDRDSRFTYALIDNLSSILANYMKQNGIKKGEIIITQTPICSEFVIIVYACLKLGAVLYPLGISCDETEIIQHINKTQCKMFFCPTFFKNTNYEQRITNVSKHTESLKHIILLDYEKEKETDNITLDSILQNNLPLSKKEYANVSSNDVAIILLTSGTTQGSKGVMLTHNNILFSEETFNKELKLTSEDIMYMPAPLHHATGFHHGLISPMLLGAKVVLQQSFECVKAIGQMNKEKCTYSMGATPFIYDILACMQNSNLRLPYLKFYLCGGAPVPNYMVDRAKNFGFYLCEVYGSTESVPHIFVRPEDAQNAKGGSCGKPLEGVEVKIVDEKGNLVKTGEIGEEASRGPNVFVGYYQDELTTNSVLHDDGWFYSGDLVKQDEQGNFYIVGRKKDMIVRGGENLNSNEIDNEIEGCPNVLDHAVIGIPDERMGERICAFIVTRNKESLSIETMQNYLKSKNVHKRFWPEHIEIIDKIPRTASGKVKKNLLSQELENRRI